MRLSPGVHDVSCFVSAQTQFVHGVLDRENARGESSPPLILRTVADSLGFFERLIPLRYLPK
jgi:hypothetical protein